jgi:hypothetical protein
MTKTSSSPSAPALARACLFTPSRAAEEARRPGSLTPALWLYLVYLLASAVFYAYKPFDFPDKTAAFPRETQNLWFWLKVMLWQPPLELLWIGLLLALVEWFRAGKLFFRLLGAVLATAAPFVLLVVYKQGGLGWWGFALLALAWACVMAFWAARVPAEQWRPVAALMLALNAIGLLMLLPMALSAAVDSPNLFQAAQIGGGLWVLLCGTLALRALTGLRLSRCFMAVLLSMFMQIAVAFSLHMLGLVPKDILKALLLA